MNPTRPGGRMTASRTPSPTACTIVPPYLLQTMAQRGSDRQRAAAQRSLGLDVAVRSARPTTGVRPPGREGAAPVSDQPERTVSTANNTESLPGSVVRREGDPATHDAATDEAYDGLGATYALYLSAYGRRSLDGAGLPLPATVHYGRDYDNAFWDGTRMVFGDGDGELFRRFTISVDVIGHELTHGVTEVTAGLVYSGQSGALNESVSDVFGSLVKQQVLGQDADAADWLIGQGLFTGAVQGVALRSMAAPGTAYDDDVLGRDPQPDHFRDYVQTTDDNGGVHLNSGIPNRAFYLAATAWSGPAWSGAGQVWYDTLVTGDLPARADFATFAAATVKAAGDRFGASEAGLVRTAWDTVGVDGGVVP